MSSFKEHMKKSLENKLDDVLPRKVKRLIFIASLIGVLENIKNPKASLLKRINDVFQLTDDSKVLRLPIYFKSYIWSDLTKTTDIVPVFYNSINNSQTEMFNAFVERIVDSCPMWLRYGSREMQEADTRKILLHKCAFDN